MTRVIILDAGPLGLVSNPKAKPETEQATSWIANLLRQGDVVVIPEVADYEVRRELLRADKQRGIAHLDALAQSLRYDPITKEVMRRAAEIWAQARRQGLGFTDDTRLDADAILLAHAQLLVRLGDPVIVATGNIRHLSRFADARLWQNIHPQL
jgi:predicted nucleic acid-binding protein